jgi:uncharacterized protein YqhQ
MEKPLSIGGQAVIEGVMMRSPRFVTVAVRKKDGSIKVKEQKFISFTKRSKILGFPLVRGITNLVEMMVIGMQAINFSADEYAKDFDEEKPTDKKETSGTSDIPMFILSLFISLAFALFLFKFVPLAITEWLRTIYPAIANNYVLFNLIDGSIRITIFIAYISTLLLFKSFRRIFEYHGAEHMSVHNFERGTPLIVANAKLESKEHPRCGTSFLILIFVVSILLYSLLPRNPVFWLNLIQRIAFLPIIVAVGYEVLKWSAKHENNVLVKVLIAPGIWSQKITTQKPDDKQIEVAIAALARAVELERT